MANIKTIIEADSSKHDSTIKKSASEVYKYQKKVDSSKKALGNIIGAVGKFAGALGVGITVVQGFNKVLHSTESLSDAIDSKIFALKESTNKFFQSIAQGNLGGFISDLKEIAKAAEDAYQKLDDLGTLKMYANSKILAAQAEIAEARAIINSSSSTDKEKQEAQRIVEIATAKMNYLTDELGKATEDAMKSVLRQMAGVEENGVVSQKTLESWFNIKSTKGGNDKLLEMAEKWKKNMSTTTTDGDTKWIDDSARVIYDAMIRFAGATDKAVQQYLDLQNEQYNARIKAANQSNKANNLLGDDGNSTNIKITEDNIEPETIKTDKVEIIPEVILDEEALNDSFGYTYTLQTPEFNSPFLDETISNSFEKVKQDMDELNEKMEINRLQAEKLRTEYENVSDAVSSIGSVFDSLGNAIGGETGEIVKFFGTMAQAISNIIPQISKFIIAKQAEATAAGTASAAGLAPPANLIAISTIVAEILSVFAAIPKFANGGVFGGSTSIGDFNLARVNKGEMILNDREQSNLFNILSNGSSNSNNSLNGGNVVFRISGSDLVGTINNYNSKKGRVR